MACLSILAILRLEGCGIAIGIMLVVPHTQAPITDDAITWSGLPELVVREVPDPALSAGALTGALRTVGLKVELRQVRDIWYVETEVPDKPNGAIVSAFEKAGIFSVPPGPLRVMFRLKQ